MDKEDYQHLREVLTEEFLEDLEDDFDIIHAGTRDTEMVPVHMTKVTFHALILAAKEGMKVADVMRRFPSESK